MPFWFLNKETNTAKIYGGVSAIIKHEGIEQTHKSRLTEHFSRKKLNAFEDDVYRIERCEVLTTKSKPV